MHVDRLPGSIHILGCCAHSIPSRPSTNSAPFVVDQFIVVFIIHKSDLSLCQGNLSHRFSFHEVNFWFHEVLIPVPGRFLQSDLQAKKSA